MDNDDLGPVAERDYPPGCIPAPRRNQTSRVGGSRVGTTRVGASEEKLSEAPLVRLPADFSSWEPRDQFLERRRIYEKLRQHYKRKKERGENVPRPDLAAMSQMNEEDLDFKFQDVGDVPGIIVGDTFHYRSEMFAVGLHRQVQAGIVHVEHGADRIATSIVASGGYEDDEDHGEILHYSGQGGNDYKGEKRQLEDQKRSGGNEAMMNSYRLKKPVRVSRGHDVETSWNKIYSYDGLYSIFYAKAEVGASGHKVYKFKLSRLPNQPPLTIRPVQFSGSQPS